MIIGKILKKKISFLNETIKSDVRKSFNDPFRLGEQIEIQLERVSIKAILLINHNNLIYHLTNSSIELFDFFQLF